MTENTTKTLPFVAHNSLIKQIIFRQHGEHFKAIVELIQNSIDAQATQISLRFDETGFMVDDNGIGFLSEASVTDYFQTFGTPHVEGDATFGTFRIGRGQIMSLANCTWRTNVWQMDVDIQNEKDPEPCFKLTTHAEKKQGCSVSGTWHQPMNRMQAQTQRKQLIKAIGFLSVPIIDIETGGRVNNAQQLTDWDIENDHFSFKHLPDSEGLTVYNLGVLVKTLDASAMHGATGILLSKKQFKMNTARETIMPSCPVWKEASNHIASFMESYIKTTGKTKASGISRKGYLLSWLHGEQPNMSLDTQVFQDYRKAYFSINGILTYKWVCVIDRDTCGYSDIIIDKVITQHKHRVLFVSYQYLVSLGYEHKSDYYVFDLFIEDCYANLGKPVNYIRAVHIDHLADTLSDQHAIIKDKDLTLLEQHVLKTLRKALTDKNVRRAIANSIIDTVDLDADGIYFCATHVPNPNAYWYTKEYTQILIQARQKIEQQFPYVFSMFTRKLYFGESSSAQAWTDGKSYIVIDRNVALKFYKLGYDGYFALAQIVMHELCHSDSNLTQHSHGLEFYELFHKLTQGTSVHNKETHVNPSVMFARIAHKHACIDLLVKGKRLTKNYTNSIPEKFIAEHKLIQLKGRLSIHARDYGVYIYNVEQLIMFLQFLGLNTLSEFKTIALEAETILKNKYADNGIFETVGYDFKQKTWTRDDTHKRKTIAFDASSINLYNIGMISSLDDHILDCHEIINRSFFNRSSESKILNARKEITNVVRSIIGGTRFWQLKTMIDDALSASTGKPQNIMYFSWVHLYNINKKIDSMSIKELKKLTF